MSGVCNHSGTYNYFQHYFGLQAVLLLDLKTDTSAEEVNNTLRHVSTTHQSAQIGYSTSKEVRDVLGLVPDLYFVTQTHVSGVRFALPTSSDIAARELWTHRVPST